MVAHKKKERQELNYDKLEQRQSETQYTEAIQHTLTVKNFSINGIAQLTCSLNIFPELHEYAT